MTSGYRVSASTSTGIGISIIDRYIGIGIGIAIGIGIDTYDKNTDLQHSEISSTLHNIIFNLISKQE